MSRKRVDSEKVPQDITIEILFMLSPLIFLVGIAGSVATVVMLIDGEFGMPWQVYLLGPFALVVGVFLMLAAWEHHTSRPGDDKKRTRLHNPAVACSARKLTRNDWDEAAESLDCAIFEMKSFDVSDCKSNNRLQGFIGSKSGRKYDRRFDPILMYINGRPARQVMTPTPSLDVNGLFEPVRSEVDAQDSYETLALSASRFLAYRYHDRGGRECVVSLNLWDNVHRPYYDGCEFWNGIWCDTDSLNCLIMTIGIDTFGLTLNSERSPVQRNAALCLENSAVEFDFIFVDYWRRLDIFNRDPLSPLPFHELFTVPRVERLVDRMEWVLLRQDKEESQLRDAIYEMEERIAAFEFQTQSEEAWDQLERDFWILCAQLGCTENAGNMMNRRVDRSPSFVEIRDDYRKLFPARISAYSIYSDTPLRRSEDIKNQCALFVLVQRDVEFGRA